MTRIVRNLTHISAIRESHPEAFAAFVEMLIEDCQDDFEVNADGIFATFYDEDHPSYDRIQKWNENTKQWELWPPVPNASESP